MTGRRIAIAAGLAMWALWAAGASGGPPISGVVRVLDTGHRAELRETIPVSRKPRAERRVAMSLALERFPSVDPGDRIDIAAELQTTNNCVRPGPLCVSPPYTYSPRIGTRLVLASRRSVTHGPNAQPITERRERACRQNPGDREHHCMFVFRDVSLRLGEPGTHPCELEECRINLVVDAHHPNAGPNDRVILGIDRPHRVAQDKGGIYAARFHGEPRPEPQIESTANRRLNSVPVDRGAKEVIYSLRLNSLREGEQLTVSASATSEIDHLPYPTFNGSQLILATRPGKTHTSPLTQRVASNAGEADEANGFNCTQARTPCTARKVGALSIRRTARRDGEPVPLFLNYVHRNAPKGSSARPGDRVKILPGGGIRAKRFPPEARG